MEQAVDKIKFKKGDVFKVVGDENFELEVAEAELIYRWHGRDERNPVYCYWHGPVYKMVNGKKTQKFFLKLTMKSMITGVEKLKKEKGFCIDYPYVERVYGLYDVTAENVTGSFKALLCECLEGPSMYHYYIQESLRDRNGIIERDEEILLFKYFLQLMYAVKFFGEQSYLEPYAHRDLKPDNVIICRKEKKIVIIDFDFAHVPDMKTMGYRPSTHFSMPATTECSDVQKDMYSLGWTLLLCLTGQLYTWDMKKEYEKWFSLDEDFISSTAGKYLDEEYSGLIAILKKMIADPTVGNAYASIENLIRDYKEFIKNYVKDENELNEVLSGSKLLLQSSDEPGANDRYKKRIRFSSENGGDSSGTVHNFETIYYSFDKTRLNFESAHLCIQNIYGELYYLILDNKVKTDADRTTYVLKPGDKFWRDEHTITIKIK